jgi:hypothetical protein
MNGIKMAIAGIAVAISSSGSKPYASISLLALLVLTFSL